MFLCCLLVLPALTLPVRAASGDVSDIKDGDILQFGQADDSIGFTAEWIVLDADQDVYKRQSAYSSESQTLPE